MIGRIHSVETGGTVDGPGIRYIVFTQGCPLRCKFCHNPDTWDKNGGKEIDVEELMEDILKYKAYFQFSKGGVTISGGEPLLQPQFVYELLKRCKEEGIHTAIDTSGSVIPANLDDILLVTDLVLLDIKQIKPEKHKDLTGLDNSHTLKLAKRLSEKNIPVWIRHVLVPGITDIEEDLKELGMYLAALTNVEKVEVLPYHKMGEYKWQALGLNNQLTDVIPPSSERVQQAYEWLTTQTSKKESLCAFI